MFLILDGNNLAWAGYYALERAMKPEDDERRRRVAVLGFGGMAFGAIARGGEPPGSKQTVPVERVAICFDEGRPLRRQWLYPQYQATRFVDAKFTANEPIVLAAVAEVARAAAMLPVEIVRGVNTEADDLIAGLALSAPDSDKRICSSDRDFLQLVDARTSVYSPVRKIVIGEDNFFQAVLKTDGAPPFPRDRFLDYRALIGDASDNIGGVAGVGAVSAERLLALAPLDAYLADPARLREALGRRSEAIERAFADGSARAAVERNRALMDLRHAAPSPADVAKMTVAGRWDRPGFEAWLHEQRFSGVDEQALLDRLEAIAAGA